MTQLHAPKTARKGAAKAEVGGGVIWELEGRSGGRLSILARDRRLKVKQGSQRTWGSPFYEIYNLLILYGMFLKMANTFFKIDVIPQ